MKNGIDAEVATISGDPKVGYHSDTILMRQLDAVLSEVRPDQAYLVSDGAEDEAVFPMIASRVRVNHVKRVYVKQSPKVESFLYMMTKAAKEPRWRRKIIVPVGLALVVSGMLALYEPDLVAPIIAVVLGLYMIFRTYEESLRPRNIYNNVRSYYTGMKENLMEGKVSFIFDMAAVIVALFGISAGIQSLKLGDNLLNNVIHFARDIPWYVIGALILHEFGKLADAYFTKGRVPRSVWVVSLGLIAVGLILVAAVDFISVVLEIRRASVMSLVWFQIGLGLAIVVAATLVYRSMEQQPTEDAWRP
jgi:putative membrane protein